MRLAVDDDAKHYLGSVGYSPTYGARPLNRAIQQEILNPLSVLILEGKVLDNEEIRVHFDGPRNSLWIEPNHEGDAGAGMDMDDVEDEIEIEEMD